LTLSLEDFERPRYQPGLPCPVAEALSALGDKDSAVLAEVLARPWDRKKPGFVGHATIAAVLEREGHKVPALSVGKHRRGDCRCFL
jgi:hypothetical protein